MRTPGTEPIQIGMTKLQSTVPKVRCPRDVNISKMAACVISVPTNFRASNRKKAINARANIEPDETLVIPTQKPKIAPISKDKKRPSFVFKFNFGKKLLFST